MVISTFIFMFMFMFIRTFSSSSIATLSADIHCINLWCYLPAPARRTARGVSTAWNQLYEDSFFDEFMKLRTFYKFYVFLSIKKTASVSIRDSLREMDSFSFSTYCSPNYTKQEMVMIEKIVIEIADKSEVHADAANLCNIFLHDLGVDLSKHRELELMHKIINEVHADHCLEYGHLRRMFRFGVHEMNRTKNKYNRFTRFAFVYFHNLRDVGGRTPKQASPQILGALWSGIESVEFIEDFLKIETLRCYGQTVDRCILLIVNDAFSGNSSLKQRALGFMVKHRELFFALNLILHFAARSELYHHQRVCEMLHFFVENLCIQWKEIKQFLDIASNEEWKVFAEYARNEMLKERMKKKSRNNMKCRWSPTTRTCCDL